MFLRVLNGFDKIKENWKTYAPIVITEIAFLLCLMLVDISDKGQFIGEGSET